MLAGASLFLGSYETLRITAPASIAGEIATGTASFGAAATAANLAAGASAGIVANTAAGVIGMSGADPSITIPALMVSQGDGANIKANLPGVTVEWFVDPTRLSGADSKNRVKLYAPSVVALVDLALRHLGEPEPAHGAGHHLDFSTQIEQCAADTDVRGEFVACAAHVALGLKFQHFIDIKDFARIAVCAATARQQPRSAVQSMKKSGRRFLLPGVIAY